ncbi:unnamed protein product [Linum trigynum]|uniref:Uncharacterized protein n=1 Tax=Linum trigynum TaxID=586398 RepID=A0AAV2F765_9ROSI
MGEHFIQVRVAGDEGCLVTAIYSPHKTTDRKKLYEELILGIVVGEPCLYMRTSMPLLKCRRHLIQML